MMTTFFFFTSILSFVRSYLHTEALVGWCLIIVKKNRAEQQKKKLVYVIFSFPSARKNKRINALYRCLLYIYIHTLCSVFSVVPIMIEVVYLKYSYSDGKLKKLVKNITLYNISTYTLTLASTSKRQSLQKQHTLVYKSNNNKKHTVNTKTNTE